MKIGICLTALLATAVMAGPDANPHNGSQNQNHQLKIEGPVDTGLTLNEMERIADTYGSPEIIVLRPTSPKLESPWVLMDGIGFGVDRSAGDILTIARSQEVRTGAWVFPDGGLLMHDDGFSLRIPPRTTVVVGRHNIHTDIVDAFDTANGGVDCGDGYYACCGHNIHGIWRARCIPDGDTTPGGLNWPVSCIHGGPGATGCQNGSNAFVVFEQ